MFPQGAGDAPRGVIEHGPHQMCQGPAGRAICKIGCAARSCRPCAGLAATTQALQAFQRQSDWYGHEQQPHNGSAWWSGKCGNKQSKHEYCWNAESYGERQWYDGHHCKYAQHQHRDS